VQVEEDVLPEESATLFPTADMRRRDEKAAALHGRLVTKRQGRSVLWGVVCYKGMHFRPAYFKLLFADGTVDDGLSHRMVAASKQYKLQPVGKAAPARVVLPAVEAVQVL
jgi:hypothetical protein